MAKVALTTDRLKEQAQSLAALANDYRDLYKRSIKIIGKSKDGISTDLATNLQGKITICARNFDAACDSLENASTVATRCAESYDNTDKALRDMMNDGTVSVDQTTLDHINNSPVSNQYVNPALYAPIDNFTKGGSVTEKFGADGGYYGHTGIDIGFNTNDDIPLHPLCEGEIYDMGPNTSGAGNWVSFKVLRNGEEHIVTYKHLKEYPSWLTKGQKVDNSTTIGIMGDTGHSFGRHLHIDVMKLSDVKNGHLWDKAYYENPNEVFGGMFY